MKVVLFCGGLGLRMRDGAESGPKPMMTIGERPVLWHVMRYYAHFGHTEFILCLGHGARAVKNYFLNYHETHSNDFALSEGGKRVELFRADIDDWRITFVDTGIDTNIGERLRRVRAHVAGDEVFLANYGDVLTDAPLDEILTRFRTGDAVASLLAVPPQASFHVVQVGQGQRVSGITPVSELPFWVNGGYFVLRNEIFDVMKPGDDLVTDTFGRLIERGRLEAVSYTGFWAPMDTLKERTYLEQLHRSGQRPWAVWDDLKQHTMQLPITPMPNDALLVAP